MIKRKQKQSLVSVIIPSYNHERYVEEAVRSVWNQTYRPIELIVVDDASQDRSVEILKRLEKESPIPMRVYVNEKNLGLPATLNRGLEKIAGEVVIILASDDVLPENRVEIHVRYLEENEKVHVVFGDVQLINEQGVPGYILKLDAGEKQIDVYDYLWGDFPLMVQGMTFRKEVFSITGSFNEEIQIEDLYFIASLYIFGIRIAYISGTSVYYRVQRQGFSKDCTKMVHSVTQSVEIISKLINEKIKYGLLEKILLKKKLRAIHHYRLAVTYQGCGNHYARLRHLVLSSLWFPLKIKVWYAMFLALRDILKKTS